MVEFALVAPLLFLLLFAMLDFGKAFNYWIDSTQLASEGARLAVVNSLVPGKCPGGSTTPASLQAYIQCQADTKELLSGGTTAMPNGAKVCITFPNTTKNVGDPVHVQVSSTYHWLPIIGNRIGIAATTLNGEATMRLEAAATNLSAGCYQP